MRLLQRLSNGALMLALLLSSFVVPLGTLAQTAGAMAPAGGKWEQIGVGSGYNCAVGVKNLYCWGKNGAGQLGNGTTNNTNTPTRVGGALTNKVITKIAIGDDHACAISEGELYCWGSNWQGVLGDGTTDDNPLPSKVGGLLVGKTITNVAVSYLTTCAVANGEAYCWGANWDGENGDGTYNSSYVPVKVTQDTGLLAGKTIKEMATGDSQTCAITTENAAYCWGYGWYGSLGNNDTNGSLVPVKVDQSTGLAGKQLSHISARADTTCVIADGALYCWGDNSDHQLADGTTNKSLVPAKVNGALGGKVVTYVTTGYRGMCAIANNKTYCWGDNTEGQIGTGDQTDVDTPTQVNQSSGFTTAEQVELGESGTHGCAISDGTLYCWGDNLSGEMGRPSTGFQYITELLPLSDEAKTVLSGKTITEVKSGANTICAVANGDLYCWGANPSNILNDSASYLMIPKKITGLAAGSISTVAVGWSHICAVMSGDTYCWGNNQNGQLGDGTNTSNITPTKVSGLLNGKTVTNITSNGDHTCVIGNDEMYCWGANYSGNLGDGTTTQRPSPIKVGGLLAGKTVTTISADLNLTCAVANAEAYCWGWNANGNVGDGSSGNTVTSPAKVVQAAGVLAGKTVTSIAANQLNACAVADGKPYCWGNNYLGQLGDGTFNDSTVPVEATEVTALLAGKSLNDIKIGCARAQNDVYCWGGRKPAYQLGGPISGKAVSYLESNVYNQCVIADGNIYCRGGNGSAQLTYPFEDFSLIPLELNYLLPNIDSLTEQMSTQITKRPTFSGIAQPGSTVEVTVHSDPVTCTTTADSNGNWSCTLPSDLPAGQHTVNVVVTTPANDVINLGPYTVTVSGGSTLSGNINSPDTGGGVTYSLIGIATAALLICSTIFILVPKKARG